jgi:phosphate transport system substrate-binding protein
MRQGNALTGRTLIVTGLLAGLALMQAGCNSGGTGTGGGGGGGDGTRIKAGGSTFIAPMMKKWRTTYHDQKKVEIDYAEKGSGNGIQMMTATNYDFGCTDAPMTAKELEEAKAKGGEVLHIPLVFGAVVVVYNLAELGDKQLKLTGPVLADIFMGKITKWNDSKIADLNPGVTLPPTGITVVRRAEPSGTTYIFTNYLSKVSETFRKEISETGAKEVKWFDGAVGKPQNQGVAGHVASTNGAIGYVELEYAQSAKLKTVALKNKDGHYVQANAETVTAACKGAEANIPDTLIFNLNDQPGEKTYPVCGTVWAVLYQDQKSANGKAAVDFLTWCVHDGQQYVSSLPYAPLSEGLVKKIDEKLKTIKFAQ